MCQTLKILKISTFHQETVGISRLSWFNPFRYRGTQRAILGQNDQNALGQVDQRLKSVKTTPKQHFPCFYIKPEAIEDFC